ncbi:MAG: hypothetical protein Sylvanvirus9_24 [Sylvanvirus sp.]|uniref:Uncharacterized protein n=1 Tax=Sylvanvirus sp. TaxID=2487774 RepID=A0A3G5AJF3_9VIRU|nr:MAG: hypothetical protein Sylvanvirus9_24 [Sylvanvirus sp.]
MSGLVQALYLRVQRSWSRFTYGSGLDPISTVIRCALLKYKPVGTKLFFDGPSIYYDEPTTLQSSVRKIHGEGADREDLGYLKEPLSRLSIWYNILHPDIRLFTRVANEGLQLLQKSYSQHSKAGKLEPLVVPAIERFATNLQEVHVHTVVSSSSPSPSSPSSPSQQYDEEGEEEVSDQKHQKELVGISGVSIPVMWIQSSPSIAMPKHFETLWNSHLLSAVAQLLLTLESMDPSMTSSNASALDLVQSIELILTSRDRLLLHI